jgi:hypothetical protein
MDEDRLAVLEDLVKEANSAVTECERRYDDVSFFTIPQISMLLWYKNASMIPSGIVQLLPLGDY